MELQSQNIQINTHWGETFCLRNLWNYIFPEFPFKKTLVTCKFNRQYEKTNN